MKVLALKNVASRFEIAISAFANWRFVKGKYIQYVNNIITISPLPRDLSRFAVGLGRQLPRPR